MNRTTGLLLSGTACFLALACSQQKIDLKGPSIFTAEGAEITCESFEGGAHSQNISALEGLPAADSVEIVDVVPLTGDYLLVMTRSDGLFRVSVNSHAYERIDQGLPPEVIYPFHNTGSTKPIVSHSISRDAQRILAIVPSAAYLSSDGGRTFHRIPLNGVKRHAELISGALHPTDARLMIIGTSSDGLYYSTDGGITARRIRTGIPGEPAGSPNFLEEISALCFGGNGDEFYAGFGNGNGVYSGSLSRGALERLDDPGLFTYPDGDFYRVTSLNYIGGRLLVRTDKGWCRIIAVNAHGKDGARGRFLKQAMKSKNLVSALFHGMLLSFPARYLPKRSFEPDPRARNRRALYISYSFTQRGNYSRLTRLLRRLDLNAVVINLKDDYGTIRVPVSDPLIRQVPGSVRPYVNVVGTIKRLRSDGIYVIARQVCFKDEKLYGFRDNRYAVKSPEGTPFRKGPEKWVDAYSEFVRDYNIAAARAIERAGVDEVQFDYIRFPDVKGALDTRRFDFKREHQTMREALASFLKKARKSVRIPIAIDLFGYTAINHWGEWIGQDVSELSRYVDVLSPMFYPSHYTGGYAQGYGTRRIFYTVYLSCKRARELSGGVILRPYIQAFYYKDNSDGYCPDYIGMELDAVKKSGLSGYIFWNDLTEYAVLIRGLRKYRGLGDGPVPVNVRSLIPKKLPFREMVVKQEGG
jgi:hypothetical protein